MALLLLAGIQATDLVELLGRLKSESQAVRLAAAKALDPLVQRPTAGAAGFSDTPVERPTPPPALAPGFYDLAVGALAEAAHDRDPKVREAAAQALAGVYGDRPAVHASLVRALESKDPIVAWYVHQAFSHVRPPAAMALPALRALLDIPDNNARSAAISTLSLYGPEARPAVPDLLRIAPTEPMALWPLVAIGIDEVQAKELFALDVRPDFQVLEALLPHSEVATAYLKKHPKVLEEGAFSPMSLFKVVEGVDSPLRQALLASPQVPDLVLAWSMDVRFRAALAERAAKAVGHPKALLSACARACGEPADRVVSMSETKAGDFKPSSAWPGVEKARKSDRAGGHGDGFAQVLVTGRLRMTDGTPAVEPRFVNTNDRMLLGRRDEKSGPLRYDPPVGRFVFYTSVFAAYTTGKAPEPGPYQTGSAQVRIEARGAKPLVVQFYDEMPDVDITLSPAPK